MRQMNVGLSSLHRKILGRNYAHVLQSILTLCFGCPRTEATTQVSYVNVILSYKTLFTLSFMATFAKYAARFWYGIDLLNMVSHTRMAAILNPVWLPSACDTSM
jgi:hypothetical protein